MITNGGAPLGVISISGDADQPGDLGYWLAEAAWGHGYTSEAARAMVDWHWSHSSLPLSSGWLAGNHGSAQILTALGFAPTERRLAHTNFYNAEMPVERVRLNGPYDRFPSLRTERLVLNATTLEDLPVIETGLGDPAVARMMATIKPNWTAEEARDWLIPRLIPSKRGFGRAIRLKDGTFIGLVGMGTPREVAYMLARPYWGKGYASEAVRAFLAMAFARYDDIDAVEADAYDDNPGSLNVLTKLGFQRVGDGTCVGIGRVEKSPSSNYRLTRSQFKASGS